MKRCTLALVLFSFLVTVTRADDPRPTILVLGEANTTPAGNGAAWPQLVQKQHPDWKIIVNADGKRLLTDFAAHAGDALTIAPRCDMVVIFLGTKDAANEAYAKNDAAAVGKAAKGLINAIKTNPNTSKATVVLCTPMPVIKARLDQWSTNAYADGEANCDAIADALRVTAKEAGVELLDFHAWAKADVDESGVPGRLVGSIGWTMRDWGHPIAAKYFDEQLTRLNPQPPDSAAFDAWKAESASRDTLQKILAETSEGLVAFGQTYPAVKGKPDGKNSAWVIELPAEAIKGDRLDVVFLTASNTFSAIGNAANRPMVSTTLILVANDQEVKIPLRGSDWQLIDETRPDSPVSGAIFRLNMQKMNYFAVTSNEEGKQRWCLARFDLSGVAGKKITAASISIGIPPSVERVVSPEKNEGLDMAKFGPPAAAIITGQDANWDDTLATWKFRDGKLPWSGGKVDAAKRRSALEDFLKTNPPTKVADEARAELAKLT